MKDVKDIVSAVWNLIKFPFQALRELTKSAYYLISFGVKKVWSSIDEWLSESSWFGEVWGAIKGWFSGIWKSITGVMTDGLAEKAKTFILNAIWPWPLIVQTYRELGQMADDWVSGLPVIGKIYKKVKGAVKSIRSGNMSESLKRALDGKPAIATDAQLEKMSAKEIAQMYADEKAAEDKSREEAARKAAESNKAALEDQTKKQTNAQISSTQMMVAHTQNNNNSVNNGIAPGDRKGWSQNASVNNLLVASH